MPESDLEMEKENVAVLLPNGLNSDGKVSALEKELEMTRGKLMASEQEVTKLKGDLSRVISENAGQLRNLEIQVAEQRGELADYASRIRFLENQRERAIEELESFEEENTKLKSDLLECTKELEASRDNVLLLEAELDSGNKHSLDLEDMYKTRLLDQEAEIERINSMYRDAQKSFLSEKQHFQSEMSSLTEQNKALEDELIISKAREVSWQENCERLNSDLESKDNLVQALNKDLNGLKLKYDTLMVEKDDIIAKLQTLSAVLSSRDDQIHQLQSQISDLSAGSKSAEKLIDQLQLKVKGLEKELELQNALISDGADEKREAIRQLCLSIEHYRHGYQELRAAYIAKKQDNHCSLLCLG